MWCICRLWVPQQQCQQIETFSCVAPYRASPYCVCSRQMLNFVTQPFPAEQQADYMDEFSVSQLY